MFLFQNINASQAITEQDCSGTFTISQGDMLASNSKIPQSHKPSITTIQAYSIAIMLSIRTM